MSPQPYAAAQQRRRRVAELFEVRGVNRLQTRALTEYRQDAGFADEVDLAIAGDWRGEVVVPGLIETARMDPMPPEARDARIAANPMGRLGRDSEVAEVIGFLASPRASYINGEAINVNGGDATDR